MTCVNTYHGDRGHPVARHIVTGPKFAFQNISGPMPPNSGLARTTSIILSMPRLTLTRSPNLCVTYSAMMSDRSAPSMPGKASAVFTWINDPPIPLTLWPWFK